jgi:hypothetical protein
LDPSFAGFGLHNSRFSAPGLYIRLQKRQRVFYSMNGIFTVTTLTQGQVCQTHDIPTPTLSCSLLIGSMHLSSCPACLWLAKERLHASSACPSPRVERSLATVPIRHAAPVFDTFWTLATMHPRTRAIRLGPRLHRHSLLQRFQLRYRFHETILVSVCTAATRCKVLVS